VNVADQLHKAARLYGDAIAARCGDEIRTYAEIEERSNRLANALLAYGLKPGDRVATWMENSISCIELDFGLAKAGLVRVSLNPRLTAREAQYIFKDSDARCLVFGASFDEQIKVATQDTSLIELRLRTAEGTHTALDGSVDFETFISGGNAEIPACKVEGEDLYCLFYTSGTTGRPKGVMLSHRAMLHVAWNLLMEVGPIAIGEKILLMQPLSHGAGFFVLPQFMKGGSSIIIRDFDPSEVMRLASVHEIEVIKLIPTMLQRILRLPGLESMKLPKLRALIYGASPMPTEPLRHAISVFGQDRLIQIYGQSECPVTLSILSADEHRLNQPYPERLVSAGRPWATVEIRVVDDNFADVLEGGIGEIVLRGPHMMSGYWKREDLTREAIRDGWLKTKDMGRIDEHGFVYLLGRSDEMIISGGYNIAPREVEDVLYQHELVQEASVVGEQDTEWGQAVVAYLVLKEGHTGREHELLEFGRDQLGFKRPKRVYLMAELPKNAAGKIQKSALKPALALACIGAVVKESA
jgi:long-chain acyl-CoA synthetase